MKEIKDLLKDHKFFEVLTPQMIDYVAGCGQNSHFRPGEYLGKIGEPADHLFVIRKGHVAVQLNHPIRGEMTILTVSSGEIGGFSWIIPPYRMQFDLKAIDNTSVIALDGPCLRKKCEEDHHLGYLLMQQSAVIMQKRLQETRMQLLDVYSSTVKV